VDVVGVLDAGVEDKVPDVLAGEVGEVIAERPTLFRLGQREMMRLLQLAPSRLIDRRAPPDVDEDWTISEGQSKAGVHKSGDAPAQQASDE